MRLGVVLFQITAIASAQATAEKLDWKWRPAQNLNSTIEEAPLAAEDRTTIVAAIINVLKRGDGATSTLPDDQLRQLASSTRVKLMDVTGDGVPEVIAQGGYRDWLLCSPTGNCPFWVFMKTGSRYSPILESFGSRFVAECRRSTVPCDIAVVMHGSATESEVRLYRLSKDEYRVIAVYDAVWPQDDNGRTARKPTIRRVR
jgi:hypothetical protein